MSLTTVNTEHFSDVELAAKAVAEDVEDLKTAISTSKALTLGCWDGDAADAFDDLSYVIEQQVKDVSEEFWYVYDTLVDTEGAYLEADQAIATEIASAGE